MSKWNKLGKVFNPRRIHGRSWLREFAQAPCTLVFEDFVRVYFSCRPPPDENGQSSPGINVFSVNKADGTLTPLTGGASGLPTSVDGLAAF